ncbi:MAG: phosphoenolpyruvate carboxylase [Polyangiaceae bacterium]|nr:phosphoenolpyruvate carboxylase [Polyangiaceae bacterium]
MIRRREVDRPLRRDVRTLGRVLGEVLAALPRERVEPVIRAFTVYFRLVNLAEQHHRIRRARAHAMDPAAPPQRGSLDAILLAAKAAGVPAARAREALRALEVTLTVTAHPTEAARRTVLEKLYRVARRLEERDRCRLTPAEQEAALAAIREEVTALWQTDELRRERPAVGDEVKNVAWYVEEILWDQLADVPARIARAFERAYGEPLDAEISPLRLHSWVGGDMDGNPRVTPDVIEDAIFAYRTRGLRRLLTGVRALGGALSQSSRHATPPPGLLASIEADAAEMPAVAARWTPRTEGEPWRRKLRFIEARLAATLAIAERRRAERRRAAGEAAAGSEPAHAIGASAAIAADVGCAYAGPAALERDLELVADTLAAAGCARSGEGRARELLRRVRALGFSIAELEVRAPAEEARAAAASLAAADSRSVSAPATDSGSVSAPATDSGSVSVPATAAGPARFLGALERVAAAQRDGGEAACRTLILSMTQGPGDVLAALRCARAAGLWDERAGCARLDVVPLFETLAALDGSARILRELLADPAYGAHARARGAQEVMLGYSDSGKEVGLLAASAALRRAQEALPGVAAEAGLPLRIFHGRGETVARGGGPAQAGILALPPGGVAGRYKATEQGEALDQKYARPELAARTLDLILGGAVLHTLDAQPRPPPADEARYAAAFDEIAEAGRRAYRALVWDDPDFAAFFRAVTPIDAIARLPIGSRPSKRRAGGLESLRAIPWVFAWTQSRAILPGWCGVGSGLEVVGERPPGAALLAEMFASWPFFRAVLDNVEMVLAKTDMDIFARYLELAAPEQRSRFAPRIEREHALTRRWIKRLTGSRRLLDGNAPLQRSIALRNPYVDPLSFLQVELLRCRRAGDESCDRPLLLTINGVAAGLRNTG